MAPQRFFADDEPALASTLEQYLGRLAKDLESQPWAGGVVALVLSGGYGRGEGGVFRSSPGAPPALYNDLEFFLFMKPAGDCRSAASWCRLREKEDSGELAVDVEFKIASIRILQQEPPTMFLHDLLLGSRVVWGAKDFASEAPPRMTDPARLPAEEATRLLFNRGSGLFFASEKLGEGSEDADGFIQRNMMKARLAMADAVLALAGKHHPLCQERARRIAEGGFDTPPGWDRLLEWHALAVEFKLRPRHQNLDRTTLSAHHGELVEAWMKVFLWVESKRLRRDFASPESYSRFPKRLYPSSRPAKNILLHLRDQFGRGGALPIRAWLDYPRAALQRALTAELAGSREEASRLLGTGPGEFGAAYARWWARYN